MGFFIDIFMFCLIIILDIIGIRQIIKAKKADKELPKDIENSDTGELKKIVEKDYFKETIDKEATIGDLGFIYNSVGELYSSGEHFIVTGIILNIALKEWIEIVKVDEDTVKIFVKDTGIKELSKDEEIIYKYIVNIPNGKEYFTMQEYWEYSGAEKDLYRFVLDELRNELENRAIDKGKYKKSKDFERNFYRTHAMFNIVTIFCVLTTSFQIADLTMSIMSLINLISAMIMSIIYMFAIVNNNKVANGATKLTKKGVEEYELLEGLKNYLKEYTTISTQDVEDLSNSREYLVYATILGIADNVIRQIFTQYHEY